MKSDIPMYGKESQELEKLYSKLIGRHNVLCSIEKVFEEDEVAGRYFEKAKEEVLESGNQSLSSMFVIALKDMIEYIKESDSKEAVDRDALKMRVYDLECENRKLRSKLDSISDFVVKTAIHS